MNSIPIDRRALLIAQAKFAMSRTIQAPEGAPQDHWHGDFCMFSALARMAPVQSHRLIALASVAEQHRRPAFLALMGLRQPVA